MAVKLRACPPALASMIGQLRDRSTFKKCRYSTRRLQMIVSQRFFLPILKPGKQSEVDDGEDEVKAEELSVVPNIGERELARDRRTQVLMFLNDKKSW